MKTTHRLKEEILQLEKDGLLRQLSLQTGLIDFCSNDYLGISNSFRLGELQLNDKALSSGSGGSRLLSGNFSQIQKLEHLLSEIHGKESALVFNSGYAANLGFFSTIPHKNSLVIFDEKIHACIKDGMRLSLSKKTSFRHNDLFHLEHKLKANLGLEMFVVVESVYSMDGDMAPLIEMAKLCKKYYANLVVDEAHSTGIYGRQGAGLVSQLGLDGFVFAKIHTFGKAMGCHGACVLGDKTLIDYLINKCRPFIYTTALSPHTVDTLLCIYEYISQNYKKLQEQISLRVKLFKSCIDHQEINSTSPIQVVLVPGNEEVRTVAYKLQKDGFDVRPVLSPTVKAGEERLRVCLHNFNTLEEVKDLAHKINSLL